MRRAFVHALAALSLAGCGSSGAQLTVSAAASLDRALTQYGRQFRGASVRLSVGGSDQLAAQIEQGAEPDVYLAANVALPAALNARRLVERPVVFAANRLVIAVPRAAARVRSLADLARPGVAIAIGSASVPVGEYARAALARLPSAEHARIVANVRSAEPDVAGVVAKVAEGAVDAGFVYATDVAADRDRVRAIALPASIAPRVAYAAAVVSASGHQAQARAFVDGLLSGAGAAALRRAGFEPVR